MQNSASNDYPQKSANPGQMEMVKESSQFTCMPDVNLLKQSI